MKNKCNKSRQIKAIKRSIKKYGPGYNNSKLKILAKLTDKSLQNNLYSTMSF